MNDYLFIKNRIIRDNFYKAVEKFLASELCTSIGEVTAADLTLARVDPRDFGPISIKSSCIENKFPRLIVSIPSESDYKVIHKKDFIKKNDSGF